MAEYSSRFRDVEDIKAEIRRQGWTLHQLSNELGYEGGAITKRLRLARPWPALDTGLATKLGVTPQQLFPDHYDPNGAPRVARRHTGKPTRRRGGSIGPKSSGALAA